MWLGSSDDTFDVLRNLGCHSRFEEVEGMTHCVIQRLPMDIINAYSNENRFKMYHTEPIVQLMPTGIEFFFR